jgi:hypothetical protein
MKNFKSISMLLVSIVSVFFISSCQNSSNESSDQNMNAYCMNNPSACQQGVYQQNYGFYPYNYNNGYPYQGGYQLTNSAYLCSCPAGSVPTYNNYGGLGCVSSSSMTGYGYAYFGWNANGLSGATNNQWTNIPQISNYTGYNNQGGCYNGVVQSCLVDQASACSSGYTCRATSAQSRLGLCVSSSAVNNAYNYGSNGTR